MPKPIGSPIVENDIICFVQAFYGNEEVRSFYKGKIVETVVKQGGKVQKGDIIAFIDVE